MWVPRLPSAAADWTSWKHIEGSPRSGLCPLLWVIPWSDVGMTEDGSRWLYLAWHAEPLPDGSGLTPRGVRQAEHLGRRLAHMPLSGITQGPLPRASATARLVTQQFANEPRLSVDEAAGDYLPQVPGRGEMSGGWADAVLGSFEAVTEEEVSEGAFWGSRLHRLVLR